MKRSKAYRSALANLDRSRNYSVGEALQLLKDGVQTKFDQTVDVAVNLGVDPRHADQMVRGTVNLRNARHADDTAPLDSGCGCPCCAGYSRAYLNHLVRAGEMLGGMLLTMHNLHYYQDLMADLRRAVNEGALAIFEAAFQEEQKIHEAENGAEEKVNTKDR